MCFLLERMVHQIPFVSRINLWKKNKKREYPGPNPEYSHFSFSLINLHAYETPAFQDTYLNLSPRKISFQTSK